MTQLITSNYEHKLACAFHRIDNRGIKMDRKKLAELRTWVTNDINNRCSDLTNLLGFRVYLGADNDDGSPNSLNLNASEKLLERVKDLGFNPPKVRKKNKDTQEYEYEESIDKLVLQKLLANPNLWPTTSIYDAGKVLQNILTIKEYNTLKIRYINAVLYNDTYYSSYGVANAVTGRRVSRKHIYGLGNNGQNFPKHGEIADRYRQCMVARRGKIFFIVDQVSAEDWPVQALAENYEALEDMRNGVNRHYKFAYVIFGIPPDILKAQRASDDPRIHSEAEMCYYLGKKSRHANNYGMQ